MPEVNGKDEETTDLTENKRLSRWPDSQAKVTIWKETYKGYVIYAYLFEISWI